MTLQHCDIMTVSSNELYDIATLYDIAKVASLPTNWSAIFLTKTSPGKGQHQHHGLHHKHLHLVLALECAYFFWVFLELIARSDNICTEGVASHLHLRACHLGIQAPCVCSLNEARVVYPVNGTRKFLFLALELARRLGEGRQERLELSILGRAFSGFISFGAFFLFIFGGSAAPWFP